MTKIIDFCRYSSIKLGPKVKVEVLTKKSDFDKDFYILGSASNVIVGNNPPNLAVLSKEFDYIKNDNNKLIIGAATASGRIFSFCKRNNIANLEFLAHLPGKLGGLVKMNAGLKEYEIFNHLLYIKTPTKILRRDEIEFGYRYTKINEIILEAAFELKYGFDTNKVDMFKDMRSNQPKEPSAGSVFKNPKGDYAGRLIEAVGLKGKRAGDVGWSEVHANFLVNYGNGIYDDAIKLIKEAKEKVRKRFGIELELEVVILDKDFRDFP